MARQSRHRGSQQQIPNRGSRRHILELVSHPDYVSLMNRILARTEVSIDPSDVHWPRNDRDTDRRILPTFCEAHCRDWFNYSLFDQYWLDGQQWIKKPTFDFLTTCTIRGVRGLLLVEAKTYVHEVRNSAAGKQGPLPNNPRSQKNYELIDYQIKQSRMDLHRQFSNINISRDHHYQLSNRIASAWILAWCGLPTALLYLGFVGEQPRLKKRIPLKDDADWQKEMTNHMRKVLPPDFTNRNILIPGGASMRMIIRSHQVV